MDRLELKAYDTLKGIYPSPRTDWQRIEGWATTGAPDTNACHKGVEAWFEFKYIDASVQGQALVKAKFRPAQLAWITRRVKCRGRVYIVLQFRDGMLIVPGSRVKDLSEGVRVPMLKEWAIAPARIFENLVAN